MKILSLILLSVGLNAYAFNSEDWLGKRAVLDREAERLQSVFADCRKLATAPAENISVPVESFPDGSIKSQVLAKQAQIFLDTGMVWAKDVTVRMFDPAGKTEAEVKAGECVIDRNGKCAWVDGHAAARYQDTELEGDGIYFSFAEEYVKIMQNAEIRSKNLRLRGLAQAQQTRDLRLTSERGDYDRKEGVLLFDGRVALDDPEYRMNADRVFVFLDGTNDLKRVVALGSVALTNESRCAYCPKVTYAKAAGKVVMYGDGEERAKLVELGSRRSEVTGSRITFWLDSEQVEVEDSTITLEGGSSAGDLKKVLDR